ncbi:hypothetical protein GCM10007052_05140 [Halioglobus japonicus]|uniref:DUF302 domain-containing protein n=1 Tax=Halioglobus japonicus TaxID=930805 RepID=UPI0015E0C797|nr:DUF302 domain-containing protein [Halioglobus japonicus]GHD08332.1 hypothetical protein GCM10007052_05140 [Halioglobus japonicus]
MGIELPKAYMILFCGPAPGGGKAMAEAPTLGLDAFCQRFLVWQDGAGKTYLSFNDLTALADRQQVPTSIALRVIDYRLGSVFGKALQAE